MPQNPRHRRPLHPATAVLLAAALLALAGAAAAQGSVRALAMGGAGTAAARGIEAVAWNPANLALARPAGFQVGLFSAAADFSNNSFSLKRYNEYTGATLSNTDKEILLGDIPDGGFSLNATASASALGVASGPFAISFQGRAGGSGTLDKDFFDLVLMGNEIDQDFRFDDTDGEAYAVGSVTLSAARPVLTSRTYRLSAGVNLRYLRGIYDFSDVTATGGLVTSLSGAEGSAEAGYRTATGGAGYAVDLGLALQAPRGWTFGLAVDNGLSSVTWDRGTERHVWSAAGDSLTATTDDFDAVTTDSDTSYAIGAYDTSLPRRLRLGASNRLGPVSFAVDLARDLGERAGDVGGTEIAAGVAWPALGWLEPRAGVALGGAGGERAAIGLGLKLGPWRWDIAVANRGRLWPDDTRGLAVATGSRLDF